MWHAGGGLIWHSRGTGVANLHVSHGMGWLGRGTLFKGTHSIDFAVILRFVWLGLCVAGSAVPGDTILLIFVSVTTACTKRTDAAASIDYA